MTGYAGLTAAAVCSKLRTMDEAVRAAVSGEGLLAVRVTPKASAERIAVEGGRVRIWVTAAPDKGKANKAVIALVAKALGVPKSAVAILRGEASREKLLRVPLSRARERAPGLASGGCR